MLLPFTHNALWKSHKRSIQSTEIKNFFVDKKNVGSFMNYGDVDSGTYVPFVL